MAAYTKFEYTGMASIVLLSEVVRREIYILQTLSDISKLVRHVCSSASGDSSGEADFPWCRIRRRDSGCWAPPGGRYFLS